MNLVEIDQREPLRWVDDGRTACVLSGVVGAGESVQDAKLLSGRRVVSHARRMPRVTSEGDVGTGVHWVFLPQPGDLDDLRMRITFASGEVHEQAVAVSCLEVRERPEVSPGETPTARVTIAMASHQPAADLFRAQIESIRDQSFVDWHCIVHDDGSDDEHLATINAVLAGDPRFTLIRANERLGVMRNFEAALFHVPVSSEFVALCDQDDRWHPNKLQRLVAELEAHPDATLIYHDLRIVNAHGDTLRDTFPVGRLPDGVDPASMLLKNSVTGCATMLRTSLLDLALPFPTGGMTGLHDHWLASCAALTGGLRDLPEVLGDYVQHGNNQVGASEHTLPILAQHIGLIAGSFTLPWLVRSRAHKHLPPVAVERMLRTQAQEWDTVMAFAQTLRARDVRVLDPGNDPLKGAVNLVRPLRGPSRNARWAVGRFMAAGLTERAERVRARPRRRSAQG